MLRKLGFVTDRESILFQAKDSTFVEVFEWASAAAFESAHDHPEVARYWEKMGQVCSFIAPGEIPEMRKPFSHFTPV
jgi:hypothetical protein